MPAVCMDEWSLPSGSGRLLEGASITAGPPCCASKRSTKALVEPVVEVVTHSDCVCNEVRALRCRHLVDTGARFRRADALYSVMKRMPVVEVDRLGPTQYINRYEAGKKKQLIEAKADMRERALTLGDARVRMFLKDDKYEVDGVKEPRCIQYRSKRYVLALGRYLKPIEDELLSSNGLQDMPFSAKHLNSYGKASQLREAWDSYPSPVAILLDHSKFDAHITYEMLECEHWYYRQVYKNDPLLNRLLRWQILNRGQTKNGTRYTVKGTRMSGDVNTSLGNTILNYAMIVAWLEECSIQARVVVDGDDSVVICDASDVGKVDLSLWKEYGMETKSQFAYEFESVEFCQCRPVEIDGVWRMIRNPCRLVKRAPWTVKKYQPNVEKRLVRTIGFGEAVCNYGCPVNQAYANWFMAQGTGRLIRSELVRRSKGEERIVNAPISSSTRESYYRAWGIPPSVQVQIETQSDWRRVLEYDSDA